MVKEVKKLNIVILKHGILKTVNKTRCIRIRPLQLPARSLDGKSVTEYKEYEEQQKQVVKEKIDYLRKKMVSKEAAPMETELPKKDEKKEGKKAVSGPVPRKIAYEAKGLSKE